MFSDPVVGNDFFGRKDVIDLLRKRAEGLRAGYRQNVAIIGHQQLGKTSLLRHFLYTHQDPQIVAFYVEIKFQAVDYFVDQFIRSLLYRFLLGCGIADTSPDSMSDLVERASSYIPRTVSKIREIEALLKSRHADEAYSRLFLLTSLVREETGKHCIVILDEFHRLGEFGIRNAFSDFGKRIMLQKDTMYLLSSSSFSASRRILAEKLSLLFGNFERVYLEPFDFGTSFEFLDRKLSPVKIGDSLRRYLVAFTDGQPFFLDVLANGLRERSRAKNESELSAETVSETLHQILFESQGVLNQFFLKVISPWTGPKGRGSHVLILSQIAKGRNKLKDIALGVNRSQKETASQIADLVESELIIKTGVFYRFHNKIFKFWLREVYERKELSLVDRADGGRDFREHVLRDIAQYDELLRMDVSDRMAKLFGLFRNETIEFGEKTKRLPRFSEFIRTTGSAEGLKGGASKLIAKGNGRCWICKIVEEKATEAEVMDLVMHDGGRSQAASAKVLIALKGLDDTARLLSKEKKVLTLGLSKINMLLDIYGYLPLIPTVDGQEDIQPSGVAPLP